VAKFKIEAKKYDKAKKQMYGFLAGKTINASYISDWYNMLLSIAQEEKDIPVIRKISFGFIKNYFKANFYRISKSSFTPMEWETELQKFIIHYVQKGVNRYENSGTDLFV